MLPVTPDSSVTIPKKKAFNAWVDRVFGEPDPMYRALAHFANKELSAESPIKAIASFPQELVLLGRATILIKGIAKRLGTNGDL